MVQVVNGKKPVVVSMVDIAASGGYSISYRARTLVANGNSITGSIGSITGKFDMKGFYNKIGMTKDGVGVGPDPDFYSDYREWTPDEFAKVRADHRHSYDTWVADIARHRGLTAAEVDSVGRGRVWTGRQALDRKLIDELGTLDDAIAAAKEAAGLAADTKVTIVNYPKPEGFLAQILSGGFSETVGRLGASWVRAQVQELDRAARTEQRLTEVRVP